MKDTFYFSHDYNARNDEKVKLLIRKHGILGYGIFWCIIEDLYNNANALRTDYEGIAYDLRVAPEMVKSIIHDFNLFQFQDVFFGSLSVERRINERSEKSKKARDSAIYRWSKINDDANALKNDANALRLECDGNAIKERKGKEIKEKKENTYVQDFELIWEAYDRKGSKKKSFDEYKKLSESVKEFLITRIETYIRNKPDRQYRKDLERYLKDEVYESKESTEVISGSNAGGYTKVHTDDEVEQARKRFFEGRK